MLFDYEYYFRDIFKKILKIFEKNDKKQQKYQIKKKQTNKQTQKKTYKLSKYLSPSPSPSPQPVTKQKTLEILHDTIQSTIHTKNNKYKKIFFKKYFKKTDDGFVPKTTRFYINGQTVDIPTFTLIPQSNIELQKLRFTFQTSAVELGISNTDNNPIQTEVVFNKSEVLEGYTDLFTQLKI
jgi:hypothetical protein